MNDNIMNTIQFGAVDKKSNEIKMILSIVCDALKEKGYDPVNQIVGYILSDDPTYITGHNNARSLIRKVERDELLEEIIKNYLEFVKNR